MLAIVAGLFRILFSYDLDVLISWIWLRIVLESQQFAYLWKSSLRIISNTLWQACTSWIRIRIVLELLYFAHLWKSSLRNNIKHFVACTIRSV
jgi:hypothetical protein